MELRTGFVPPFPGTHALFLSDEELTDLKYMSSTAMFTKATNIKLLKALRSALGTTRAEPYG